MHLAANLCKWPLETFLGLNITSITIVVGFPQRVFGSKQWRARAGVLERSNRLKAQEEERRIGSMLLEGTQQKVNLLLSVLQVKDSVRDEQKSLLQDKLFQLLDL